MDPNIAPEKPEEALHIDFKPVTACGAMIPEAQSLVLREIVEKEEIAEPSESESSSEDETSLQPATIGPSSKARGRKERKLQREKEENNIQSVIEKAKIAELRETIQPWRLAKCKTNSLIIALKTSSKLRKLAKNNLSEGQELTKLGNSCENFACALVEPFEEDEELADKLKSSAVDTVIETSVACQDKKFLSKPVIYNLIVKTWYGKYSRLAKKKHNFLDYCWWILLHVLSIVDILLSPVVFLMLFTVTWLQRKAQHGSRRLPVPLTRISRLAKNVFKLGRYLAYLETPYFIFVKDSLSYITLLGLHFTLCVTKSTIQFSALECVILVFFAGRIANEVYQFLQSKDVDKRTHTGEEPASWIKKQFHSYLSDIWNIMDFSTIVIYLITLIVRIITWSIGGDVIHNRTLVVAHYLYGLNASLITIRTFGQIMETNGHMGPIQIALFRIVSGLGAITGQFLAIILAFSLAFTKFFVAEMSYNLKEKTQQSYCKSNGIECWWQTVKQLLWSLFGLADISKMYSSDGITTAIALTLYVVFLILAVILLVNMMIALLSNTYQRVEDNSVDEWSYKRAITVMTYKYYHPIIVPMNLISLPIYIIWRNCQKNNPEAQRQARAIIDAHNFNRVVREDLEPRYWAKYGYSYPPTDKDKTDSILYETTGTRHITSKIAEAVFSPALEGIPFGSSAWDAKGIAVNGCRLWYSCDDNGDKHHGAIYCRALTRDFPKFEVLIQDFGERRFLSVGLVCKDHNHQLPPGSQCEDTKTGTVGFHVDDGRIFDPDHVIGKEIPGSMAHRGDLVSCKALFKCMTSRGGIPVVFSLNGNDLDLGGEQLEVKPNGNGEVPLHPFISMGHKGISILFKLCPSEERAEYHPSKLGTLNTSPMVKERLDHLEARLEQMTSEMDRNQTQIISQLSFLTDILSDLKSVTLEKQEDTS